MTVTQGTLRKMRVHVDDAHVVQYQLPVGENLIDMNELIGTEVSLTYSGNIYCVHCNSKTKKSFNQGYCYRCLITLAQCDSCIIKPEQCHYHEGTCREPEWGEQHCLTDHFVYLANTGTLKVGITRHVSDVVSSRWMDQGASEAMVILRVKDRLTSGEVETLCKQHIADKTNWRTMLKGEPDSADLVATRDRILSEIQPQLDELQQKKGLQALSTVTADPVAIHYPVEQYPEKIKSINLDKTPEFSGTLQGIKGQYWLLDGDRVINMRKYAGYDVEIGYSG
ncbi:DUF2797 domain-containing protein [Alteromonas sp. ASW11-19]|uniref:DUF2797 domain-containing protein n=1 Tax=Alteromonas salexigens TaxID=2982530 RepID=A0ABT2VM09_9ALTE|nr:DUF2797 domain-containing protein [Alteromonas salexigens]MCU7554347.1 DUF2797 domain-containing protein [Alteromonas salexigens]